MGVDPMRGETAFGHLHVRMFLDSRKAFGLSGALLFVDVIAAFASMLRRIIFIDEAGDEAWLKSLADAGFPPEDIKVIYDTVCDIPWLYSSEFGHYCESHAFIIAQSFYNNIWFSTESLDGVVHTKRGSGVGLPLV